MGNHNASSGVSGPSRRSGWNNKAVKRKTTVSWYQALTVDAIDLGLDAALPPVIELESKIDEFGRGERI